MPAPSHASRTDARWIRAHAALQQAVLKLAAQQPIETIGLTALAAEAGVSRSTAYQHATTARELLEEVLVGELDEARDRHLTDIGPADVAAATAATTLEVAHHIDRHSDIYRIGLAADAGASSLGGMLDQHFAASTQLLLDTGGLDHAIPAADEAERRAVDALVVRGIAASAVGQFAAWVAQPAPRDIDLFARVNLDLLPPWWRR